MDHNKNKIKIKNDRTKTNDFNTVQDDRCILMFAKK